MEGFSGALNVASWLARAVLLMVPSWATGFSLSIVGVEKKQESRVEAEVFLGGRVK